MEFAFHSGKKVMFIKCITIGTVHKRYIQHLRVCHGLLQAKGNRVIVIFCLNNGNRVIALHVKNIVRLLWCLSGNQITPEIDLPIGELHLGLHGNLALPSPLKECWRDVIELDVFFCHLTFRQDCRHMQPSDWFR